MTAARRIGTALAGLTLTLGLVACSDTQETDSGAGSETATAATGAESTEGTESSEGVEETEDSAGGTESSATEDAESTESTEPTEGESAQVTLADGSTVLVNSELAQAIESADEDAVAVEENENGAVVTLANDDLITYSEETGTQPLVGMIGQTWLQDGGLANEVGLPTAPEVDNGQGAGWTQEFTNGIINWAPNEAGEYAAEVLPPQ